MHIYASKAMYFLIQKPLRKYIQLLENNGVYSKLLSDAVRDRMKAGINARKERKRRKGRKGEPLNLHQLGVVYLILVAGLGAALMAFVIEVT